jgi:hypothetical protein
MSVIDIANHAKDIYNRGATENASAVAAPAGLFGGVAPLPKKCLYVASGGGF